MIEKLVIQKLTIAGKEYEYPDTTALVGKINELADAVNELQATISKMEKVETPAENVQSDPETRSENVRELITLTDMFNEMGRLYADLWNKMEDIHHELKNKGAENEQ